MDGPAGRCNLRFASLFCGCGGFDAGFIAAGYRCVGAYDLDSLAVDVHQKNLGSSAVVCDLSRTNTPAHRLRELDVLLAGSPCQGFSTAGKRDPRDPRNKLLIAAGRIASVVRPKVFVAENVTGVVAGSQRRYWEHLRHLLHSSGYKTRDLRCDATRMGVPQIRRRMVMLAWRGERELKLDLPSLDGGTIRSALREICGAPNHSPRSLEARPHLLHIAKHIAPGQKLSNVRGGSRAVHTWQIPEIYGPTTREERKLLDALMKLRRRNRKRNCGDADPVSLVQLTRYIGRPTASTVDSLLRKNYLRRVGKFLDLVHTFNGKCRRLEWDSAAPTVDTRFGDPWYFLHPSEDRGMTVREAARLQGFPDNFVFSGPERAQYRLIGNAVPPPLAALIAAYIREALFQC